MELIKEIDVSSYATEELKTLKDYYEKEGYTTCIKIYEGFVDTWILELYA